MESPEQLTLNGLKKQIHRMEDLEQSCSWADLPVVVLDERVTAEQLRELDRAAFMKLRRKANEENGEQLLPEFPDSEEMFGLLMFDADSPVDGTLSLFYCSAFFSARTYFSRRSV